MDLERHVAAIAVDLLEDAEHAADTARRVLVEFAMRRGLSDDAVEIGEPIIARYDRLEMSLLLLKGHANIMASTALPGDARNDSVVAKRLLRANLRIAETAGGVFAAVGSTGEIRLLHNFFVSHGDVGQFERDVETAFSVAASWRKILDLSDDTALSGALESSSATRASGG